MSEIELDKDFAADDRIFHYTSSAGLYGILESKCLWATHFRFLNDSQEIYSARESLIKAVGYEIHRKIAAMKTNGQIKFNKPVNLRELCHQEADTIVNAMYVSSMAGLGYFIFSGFVCGQANQEYNRGGLLHWATYGRGGGYALRMNPHILSKLFKTETEKLFCGFRSSPVFYADAGKAPPAKLAEDYDTIAKAGVDIVLHHLDGDVTKAEVGNALAPFDKCISLVKHPFFSNEHEARVIMSFPRFTSEKPRHAVHIRHRGTTAIPYIRLFESDLFGDLCPIEGIIIGPHFDQERRREALEVMLESMNLHKRVEIVMSDVPYLSD